MGTEHAGATTMWATIADALEAAVEHRTGMDWMVWTRTPEPDEDERPYVNLTVSGLDGHIAHTRSIDMAHAERIRADRWGRIAAGLVRGVAEDVDAATDWPGVFATILRGEDDGTE